MFRKKEEQSLINASRKALKEAESKIEERNILIADMKGQADELNKENKALEKRLSVAEELINRLVKLAEANKYENEKVFFNKIIELISDYHSQN